MEVDVKKDEYIFEEHKIPLKYSLMKLNKID